MWETVRYVIDRWGSKTVGLITISGMGTFLAYFDKFDKGIAAFLSGAFGAFMGYQLAKEKKNGQRPLQESDGGNREGHPG